MHKISNFSTNHKLNQNTCLEITTKKRYDIAIKYIFSSSYIMLYVPSLSLLKNDVRQRGVGAHPAITPLQFFFVILLFSKLRLFIRNW